MISRTRSLFEVIIFAILALVTSLFFGIRFYSGAMFTFMMAQLWLHIVLK